MTPQKLEEYRALRATIQERGTQRVWVFVAGTSAWAGLTVATAALTQLPVATLVPLLVLAAVFEAVLALHTGVERIGRYIQVFFEGDSEPGWEHRIMAYGTFRSGLGNRGSGDPLFTAYFLLAAFLNFMPAILAGPVPVEYGVVGGIHLLFGVRLVVARQAASKQRAVDLERFTEIKKQSPL